LIPKTFRGLITLAALMLIFSGLPNLAAAQATHRVLILPVNIHSPEKLDYLQTGIRDMLASRLMLDDSVTVIGAAETAATLDDVQQPITEKSAVTLARKLGADYVVMGSLTLFGSAVSTDLRMLQTESGQVVTALNQTARDQDEIIGHVDGFAQRVNSSVFGRTAAPPPVPPVPTVATAPAVPQENLRQHPDKLLEQAMQSPTPQHAGSGWVQSSTTGPQWTSTQYPFEILGLAMGDITGDGRNELVFIDAYNIYIAEKRDNKLVQIAHHSYGDYHRFLHVDVADINGNGRAEIFITDLPEGRNWLESFVLEFNGSTYVTIAKPANLYYRVIEDPQGKAMLLSQRRDRTDDFLGLGEAFSGKIQSLVWQNGNYREDHALGLPPNVSIYEFVFTPPGFSRGDIVYFNDSNRLLVATSSGDTLWESSDKFGGTNVFQEIHTADAPEKEVRLYLPNRVLSADLDGDGRREILTIHNNDAASSFEQWRSFKDANIVALTWNGLAMEPIWMGQKAAKFIADVAYGDLDNDGRSEIIYAVITKTGKRREKGISIIAVEQPGKPENK
jgi:TolB-like protein